MAGDGDTEFLEALGEEEIIQGIEAWGKAHRYEFLDAIQSAFDVDGEQEAVAARPTGVRKIVLKDGSLFARVNFKVTYKNPIDEYDRDMSAENVTDDAF